jgi:hypothetical protein
MAFTETCHVTIFSRAQAPVYTNCAEETHWIEKPGSDYLKETVSPQVVSFNRWLALQRVDGLTFSILFSVPRRDLSDTSTVMPISLWTAEFCWFRFMSNWIWPRFQGEGHSKHETAVFIELNELSNILFNIRVLKIFVHFCLTLLSRSLDNLENDLDDF